MWYNYLNMILWRIVMSGKIIPLSDGVEGLFVKNTRFNTTLISFNFYVPLAADTAAEYALLPFMLTTCSKKYPDFSALNYKLASLYGAQLEASAEKFGDCQLLRMSVSVINDRFTFESESLVKQASDLIVGLIFEPNTENGAFYTEDLAREKRKAIEHIKGEISEKRIYAKNRLISEMYRGKAYGVPKCGTEDDVLTITGESLYSAWRRLLSSAFVRVQVVGSSVPTGLFEDIGARFETVERRDITDVKKCAITLPADSPTTVDEHMDVTQGKLVMGFSSELAGDDDKALPLMVMTDIFGGGPYSRLFTNVREKMSLCYYCSASSVRQKGLLTVDSGVEAKNAEKAQNEILNQLEAVKRGEFTDFEYNSSLKSIADSLKTYNDSQISLDLWYALKAANPVLYSPEDIAEKVSHITREEVINAANGIKLHTVYRLLPKEAAE